MAQAAAASQHQTAAEKQLTIGMASRASTSMSLDTTIKLANGIEMPILGYGTSHQGGWSDEACNAAIKAGCKLYDTAKRYGSEPLLARCLAASEVPAADVFLTTKLWPGDDHDVAGAFRKSCSSLGVDTVDLYLVHWPGGGNGDGGGAKKAQARRLETWRQMELILDSGRARAIGVSNFMEHHIGPLLEQCTVKPHVNQIELNPCQNDKKLRTLCQANDVVVEAYCPLAKGSLMRHPTIDAIAKAHKRSIAQVAIRWGLQHGCVSIPKSTNPAHVIDNLKSVESGWELSADDMAVLDGLHQDLRVTWDPSDVP